MTGEKLRWTVGRALAIAVALGLTSGARADFLLFDTGAPNGQMAMASRPGAGGKTEIEAADDFISAGWGVTSASFTGLLVGNTGAVPTVGDVVVEIYRVFPKDSDTVRTPNVPTRVNSPSDVAFDSRSVGAGSLSFTTTTLAASFTAANSVLNGINPKPNQTTGGEGAVTGTEVRFNVTFATPFNLPADHYFFIPQVQVTGGEFYWLSGQRPIAGQFAFSPDLQAWIRNGNLDPDWLRVGTDIVGGATPPTFNGSFSLTGVPEPSSMLLLAVGGAGVGVVAARRSRRPTDRV
jgi:PEP-CTERM motif